MVKKSRKKRWMKTFNNSFVAIFDEMNTNNHESNNKLDRRKYKQTNKKFLQPPWNKFMKYLVEKYPVKVKTLHKSFLGLYVGVEFFPV